QIVSRRPQPAAQPIDQNFSFTESLISIHARDRAYAPHSRRDRLVTRDFEQPDIAGRTHVCTTAKLFRKNPLDSLDRKHPHTLAVLLTKQRHRPRTHRFVDRHLVRLHRLVAQNVIVDEAFDLFFFSGCERLVMREIKSQISWRDDGSRLLYVRSQDLT